jgi:hypothetical protein
MYFDNDVVQVDLDDSYLTGPETAYEHALDLVEKNGLSANLIEPKNFTASTLPDIPVNFDFMCSPRSISDLTSKIGLGHIGTRVRRIVQSARFPVLITTPVYSEWKSITVFFGGSINSIKALKLGIRLSRLTGMELSVFTQLEGKKQEYYEKIIEKEGLGKEIDLMVSKWDFFDSKSFEENLYDVPHNALAIIGAYGHSLIKNIIFGSKMEKMQSTILNNFLVVGPNYGQSSSL